MNTLKHAIKRLLSPFLHPVSLMKEVVVKRETQTTFHPSQPED